MNESIRKWPRDRPFLTTYVLVALALIGGALFVEFVLGYGAVAGILAAMAVLAFAFLVVGAIPAVAYTLFNRFRYRNEKKEQKVYAK